MLVTTPRRVMPCSTKYRPASVACLDTSGRYSLARVSGEGSRSQKRRSVGRPNAKGTFLFSGRAATSKNSRPRPAPAFSSATRVSAIKGNRASWFGEARTRSHFENTISILHLGERTPSSTMHRSNILASVCAECR